SENLWRCGFHLSQHGVEAALGARREEAIFAAIQENVWVHVRPVEQDKYLQRAMNANPVIRAEPFSDFLKLATLVVERSTFFNLKGAGSLDGVEGNHR